MEKKEKTTKAAKKTKSTKPAEPQEDKKKFYEYLYKIVWQQDKGMLKNIVAKKHITQKDYEAITGEKYEKGE